MIEPDLLPRDVALHTRRIRNAQLNGYYVDNFGRQERIGLEAIQIPHCHKVHGEPKFRPR
jgi:hypothetical protein